MVVEGLNMVVNDKTTMRKITLSLTEKTETKLREIAKDKYGGMRGALSIIVENALQDYFKKMNNNA